MSEPTTRSRLERSDEDAILPVSIGTGVWIVVLVVLVLMRERLDESGLLWWIGAAAVGVVSGALGLVFLRWRRARAR
jgi:integral membrane sensor domain MASE1